MNKNKEQIETEVIETLKTIYDPEIPVNIYELGLIYKISSAGSTVEILMTLTSPNCPMTDVLMYQIDSRLKLIDGVEEVKVDLTFEPPWDKDMISEEGKLKLGLL
jgi:FeS assembly SUF system protein